MKIEIGPDFKPSKIVCVGRNYAEHAAELGNTVPTEPLLFLKAPSALIRNGETIVIPEVSSQVEHEGELAVVISKTCKNLADNANPLDHILGYACLNDVTARDIQRKDVQFTRGKSFDTFCPIGPVIETELDVYGYSRCNTGQRFCEAGWPHFANGLRCRFSDTIYLKYDDAVRGRCDCDGNAVGRFQNGERRCLRSGN